MILLIGYDVRRRGGIERLTLQVQGSLERQGQRVRLLCPRRLGPGPAGRWLGRVRFLLALLVWLPRSSRVLSMHALLLAPLRWLAPLQPGGVAARAKRYCWLHGIEVWGPALEEVRPDLQACRGLIASSRFTRQRVVERGGAWPPIAVVHPMADRIDAAPSGLPLPPDPVLLTVARMASEERYKGHRLVLEALDLLRRQGRLPSGLQWRIVGDGDDRAALEEETRRRALEPWVRFLGAVDDRELERELRGCSLLVLPSAYGIGAGGRAEGEGFGIVYLEAAQAGRASLACRQGGQSDLIVDGETGWLVDPDPGQLAERLCRLLADPGLLREAGERARERAQTFFGLPRFDADLAAALDLPGAG